MESTTLERERERMREREREREREGEGGREGERGVTDNKHFNSELELKIEIIL